MMHWIDQGKGSAEVETEISRVSLDMIVNLTTSSKFPCSGSLLMPSEDEVGSQRVIRR